MRTAVERVLEKVFLPGLYRRMDDEEDARKLILVNSIRLFAIVVLTIVGTAPVIRGSVRVGVLDLSAAFLLCLCIVHLRRTGRHRIPIVTGMSIVTCLDFYLFITGGVNGTSHLWYYTYPLLPSTSWENGTERSPIWSFSSRRCCTWRCGGRGRHPSTTGISSFVFYPRWCAYTSSPISSRRPA